VAYARELKNTLRLGSGVEWLLPIAPAKLRLGVYYQTRPYIYEETSFPVYYTGGLGFLIDRVLSIDLATRLNEMEMKVVEIIQEHCAGVEIAAEDTEKALGDIGVDSLDLSAILLGIEEKFEIEIPDEDVGSLTSIKNIVIYVEGAKAN